jgi:3-isopropylmalate dehydratase small subunit
MSTRLLLEANLGQLANISVKLAPAEFLVRSTTNEEIGQHCLEYTHPDFRQRVKDGFNIVVAGTAFGCGSSREQAVMALLGTLAPNC